MNALYKTCLSKNKTTIFFLFFLFLLNACTHTTKSDSKDDYFDNDPYLKGSSERPISSSSFAETTKSPTDSLFWKDRWVYIPFEEGFELLSTEVTQEMYSSIMDTLPFQKDIHDSLPVISVSWYDAALFCNALSKILGLDSVYEYSSIGPKNTLLQLKINQNNGVYLPSLNQWLYALNGKSDTDLDSTTEDNLRVYAHFGRSNSGPIQVAQKQANHWNLYDMFGNVEEWVAYCDGKPVPTNASTCMVKGGSWASPSHHLKSDFEKRQVPDTRSETIGFRVAKNATK